MEEEFIFRKTVEAGPGEERSSGPGAGDVPILHTGWTHLGPAKVNGDFEFTTDADLDDISGDFVLQINIYTNPVELEFI